MNTRAFAFALLCAISAPALAQQAQVRSSATTFDSGTMAPLQADTTGALRVTGGTGTSSTQQQGNVASGATDSGNPMKIGGVYNTTKPTFTNGQRGDVQIDTRGNLFSIIRGEDGVFSATVTTPTDGLGTFNALWTYNYAQVYNGSTWNFARGDANGGAFQKGLSATQQNYSSGATGILSNTTTAVTMFAAAGASIRTYLDSCQISTTAFGATVPIVLRDGAGGTVKWAGNVPTTGWLTPVTIVFEVPLKGTANTLWEVATPTANTSGTAFVNCQAHQGS